MFASDRRGRNDANFGACVDQEAGKRVKSLMKNRRLGYWPRALMSGLGVSPIAWLLTFLSLPRQIWYGTSKGNLWSKTVDAEGQDSMYGGMWLAGMKLQGCNQLCQTRDVLVELFDF